MGIAGLNLKFNKKVKANVERESIFIIKSHQTGPQFQKKYLQWWQNITTPDVNKYSAGQQLTAIPISRIITGRYGPHNLLHI